MQAMKAYIEGHIGRLDLSKGFDNRSWPCPEGTVTYTATIDEGNLGTSVVALPRHGVLGQRTEWTLDSWVDHDGVPIGEDMYAQQIDPQMGKSPQIRDLSKLPGSDSIALFKLGEAIKLYKDVPSGN